ncbi:peptidoglycan-binding protein [Flavobacterium sp. 5]|uniref:peptidoglycan-binding domain-containing protein n=1 Tax=Flavobacterium sp. 5 TaxID=2035199 RepID=UPI000C2B99BB|nr:peptidoglycan-binding domain-containing protein [Flavobacterium sp. 5]PKB18382.1 hypothetical protein CLU82_3657 [Flavobacterium sp. 5]
MEAEKKQGWTKEDKNWAIGGGVAILIGGIYWYMKNKNTENDDISANDAANYIDSEQTTVEVGTGNNTSSPVKSDSTSTATTSPASATRQPDAIRWKVGQVMMANSAAGTKAYKAKNMANGQYISDGTLAKTFAIGDKIGKIIWVGTMSDGTFRYVIQVDGIITNDYFWIADYRVITPIDGSKAVSTTVPVSTSLNTNLVLKYGSKGNEVKELQKRLGVAMDGDFGTNTLTALQKQKGVSQITLANFNSTSNLNFNLTLKKGSKGLEVKELQKRLGFASSDIDGDFGVKTESALFAMKKVKQTTLNQFSYV